MNVRNKLKQLLCDWTHGGGDIQRDPLGRINWRCRKCGRWSPNPVPLQTEREVCDRDLQEANK